MLKGTWLFLWMPPAVMKATLHALRGFFSSVKTGAGVTGTKISDCIPATVVSFISKFLLSVGWLYQMERAGISRAVRVSKAAAAALLSFAAFHWSLCSRT